MSHSVKIKIGAHEYEVIYANVWEGMDDGDNGETFDQRGQIYINASLPPSEQFSTLIHEMMHVMNRSINHALLDSLAEQMSQALWDNNITRNSVDSK